MKSLIQTATPKTAQGDIKKGFDLFEKRGVPMPDPLRLITASPGYFSIMLKRNLYFSSHPALGMSLLAHIRYFVSLGLDFSFCTEFNRSMILKMGMTEQEFHAMGDDPKKTLLEDKDKKMLIFVLKAMDDPEGVTADDLKILRRHGWTDGDILDALIQGVGMMDHNLLLRIFKRSPA